MVELYAGIEYDEDQIQTNISAVTAGYISICQIAALERLLHNK